MIKITKPLPQRVQGISGVAGDSYELQMNERVAEAPGLERVFLPTIPVDERKISLAQIELGYALQQAIEEASRCMRRYQVRAVGLDNKLFQ